MSSHLGTPFPFATYVVTYFLAHRMFVRIGGMTNGRQGISSTVCRPPDYVAPASLIRIWELWKQPRHGIIRQPVRRVQGKTRLLFRCHLPGRPARS